MNIEIKIDYLQFSARLQPRWVSVNRDDFRTKSNMSFYTHMTEYESGLRIYEGNPNTDKRLFVLSGRVCDRYNVSRVEWLQNLMSDKESKVSRIDIALTTDSEILDKFVAAKKSIVSEKFTEMKVISDHEYTPQTVYCGDMSKRGKKGIVRAYDKALQLGVDGILQRIEVELRRDDAQLAAKRLACGESLQSVMNSKFRIDEDWYKNMLGSDVSVKRFETTEKKEITEIERKMSWLEKQVVPTLQYVLDYDKANGTENFSRLINSLRFDIVK